MDVTSPSNSEPSTANIPLGVKTGQTPPDVAPPSGGVSFPENWKDAIPEDIRGAEVFKLVPDVQTLAKNYFHAQKAIGVDKIPVPSKHATDDDWKNVYKKLGLPETIDKYEVKPNSKDADIDQAFFGEFKEVAYNSNILPHQAQKMIDWYVNKSGQMVNEQQGKVQAQSEAAVAELKKEFGAAYDQKITTAKNLLKEVGGDELAGKIAGSYAGSDPNVIKLLVKVADLMKDHPVKGEAVHGIGAMTPAEAMVEMAKLRGDNAFTDRDHPNHANAVENMNRLAQFAYPE